jgi:hypothetical protein
MDEAVRRAMAKWPDVPAVFGWLALDVRGQWLLQNERIGNSLMIEYIGRNYAGDAEGRWFFQNGPQRVFAELHYAPWVLRTSKGNRLTTHTGKPVDTVKGAWMDRAGILVLDTELGAGIVDDRDVESLAPNIRDPMGGALDENRLTELLEQLQEGRECGVALRYAGRTVPLLPIRADEVPRRLGFVRIPQPRSGESSVSR